MQSLITATPQEIAQLFQQEEPRHRFDTAWRSKNTLTSDTFWYNDSFIPFWFQFINVYQVFRYVSDLLPDQFQLAPIWGTKPVNLSQVTSIINPKAACCVKYSHNSGVTLGHVALADGCRYRDVALKIDFEWCWCIECLCAYNCSRRCKCPFARQTQRNRRVRCWSPCFWFRQ